MTSLNATAPHIRDACRFADLVHRGAQPDIVAGAPGSSGRLLHKRPGNSPETVARGRTPGRWRPRLPRDEFCHLVRGRARYSSDEGEVIDVAPGTCVVFPAGRSGQAEIFDTIRNVQLLR